MTRFARAKGSKASNERIPEEATPWSQMKKQLLEREQQSQEIKKKQEADKQREKNYNNFLEEVEEDKVKNVKWAEFSSEKASKKQKREANNNETEVPQQKKRKTKEQMNSKVATEGKMVSDVSDSKKKKKKKKRKLEDVSVSKESSEEQEQIYKTDTPQKKKKKRKLDDVSISKDSSEEQEQINKMELPKKKKKNGKIGNEAEQSGNGPSTNLSSFTKEKPKKVKVVVQKKGVKLKTNKVGKKVNKNKSNNTKSGTSKNVPLSEEDLKKIEKKKQKKVKQFEKRKLKKQQNDTNHPAGKKSSKTKNQDKPERRKKTQERITINGKEVDIMYMDGFPIKKEDAERILQLRKQMISKGLPRSEIRIALKLERRKAEKALAREKKKVCFNCRKSGHNLSECPDLGKQIAESSGTGICFKCGSTEHTHFECKVVRGQEFKFAQCFICQEQGHIARQCPDNARGLYPKGGACKVCGDVTHLKKDCPKYQAQQQHLQEETHLEMIAEGDNPDSLGKSENIVRNKEMKRPNKIIRF